MKINMPMISCKMYRFCTIEHSSSKYERTDGCGIRGTNRYIGRFAHLKIVFYIIE